MKGLLDRPLAVVKIVRLDNDPRSNCASASLSLDLGETVHPFELASVGTHPDINPRWRRQILLKVTSISKDLPGITFTCDRKSLRLAPGAPTTVHHKRYGAFRLTLTGFTSRRQLRAERVADEGAQG